MITNKTFYKKVKKMENRWEHKIHFYNVYKIGISATKIKKKQGFNSYDIIVSVEDLDVSVALIKDIIEEVCEELEIFINRILIEL